jgi:DnaK suppressor protein
MTAGVANVQGPARQHDSAAGPGLPMPRWRGLLEAQWQARLREVTELALAYHDTAERAPGRDDRTAPQLRRLMQRAVAARRALADTEEALRRVSAGRYGQCEQCSAAIPPGRLTLTPEARYCPRCAPDSGGQITPGPCGAPAGRRPR